jgi:hypothetical protein
MKLYSSTVILLPLVFILIGCTQPEFNEDAWLQEVESTIVEKLYAEHYKDGIYFNPWIDITKGITDVLTWRLSRAQTYNGGRSTSATNLQVTRDWN